MSLASLEHGEAYHVGQFTLRRLQLGELSTEESGQIQNHLAECAICRSKAHSLDEEKHQFQSTISFEQFAGGVERARRVPRTKPKRPWLLASLGTCTVAAAILVFLVPRSMETNRIKGDETAATVRIAGPEAQRSAIPTVLEQLRQGERLRLGYRSSTPAFLLVLSIDVEGQITPLYPESGAALQVPPSQTFHFLPDSIEFTGQGHERLFLFLAPTMLSVDAARSALTRAYSFSQGNLAAFPRVVFEGPATVQTFTWLFAKP